MEGFQGSAHRQDGKLAETVEGLQRVSSQQMVEQREEMEEQADQMLEQAEQMEEQGGLCTVALDEWLTDSLATALATGKQGGGHGIAEWQETTLEEYLRERWVRSALLTWFF